MKDIVYLPAEKKLNLVFEYIDYDFKKFMNEHKDTLSPLQIKVSPFFFFSSYSHFIKIVLSFPNHQLPQFLPLTQNHPQRPQATKSFDNQSRSY